MDPKDLFLDISLNSNKSFENELMAVKSFGGRLFYEIMFTLIALLAFVGNSVVVVVEFYGKKTNHKIQTFISSNTLIIANFYRKLLINEKLYYFQGFFKDLREK